MVSDSVMESSSESASASASGSAFASADGSGSGGGGCGDNDHECGYRYLKSSVFDVSEESLMCGPSASWYLEAD